MSDPHDREPIDDGAIRTWRINYGLDKRTPAQAAQWWYDNFDGKAPAGAVAALGVALDELEALRAEVEALREALSFYADENNHTYRQCNDGDGRIDLIESNVMFDRGAVAKAAIAARSKP
jgi:hypothetical protein